MVVTSSVAYTVMLVNASRCEALIQNTSDGARIRCMSSTQGTPTATLGKLIGPSFQLRMGSESKEAWKCISIDGVDATVEVVETIP
jgi:hypothetical protein